MSDGHQMKGEELVAAIPREWLDPVQAIARKLAEAGQRAWIVGGCVRDLILGRPLKDVDLVSAALPDEVESLFERTVGVGKSFGIVVVVLEGREFEVATFRKERGYSDRRRPDEIEFATTPEVDARRRDFTCNALFLDPLDGTLVDPTGGAADLRAGLLRAVGDAAVRFREDGLRILRMARFLAALDLEPASGLLEAARAEADSLDGVSPERVLDELGKILRGPRAAVAVQALAAGGHFDRCLPGWAQDEPSATLRVAVIEALGGEIGAELGVELGLAALLEAAPVQDAAEEQRLHETAERIVALRGSRDLRREVLGLIRRRHRVALAAVALATVPLAEGAQTAEARGALIAAWREPGRADGVRLARAWAGVTCDEDQLAQLADWAGAARQLADTAPSNPVVLSAEDLVAEGIARGPALGDGLRRMQHAALGGAFVDREEALAWVRQALR